MDWHLTKTWHAWLTVWENDSWNLSQHFEGEDDVKDTTLQLCIFLFKYIESSEKTESDSLYANTHLVNNANPDSETVQAQRRDKWIVAELQHLSTVSIKQLQCVVTTALLLDKQINDHNHKSIRMGIFLCIVFHPFILMLYLRTGLFRSLWWRS